MSEEGFAVLLSIIAIGFLYVGWSKDYSRLVQMRKQFDEAMGVLREVRHVAFNENTVSAVEHRRVGPPEEGIGLSQFESLGYAQRALRSIRDVLGGDK